MASSFQPKISYSMSMQKQGSRKSGDRPTSVLTVWSGPAVPADALDLTGGEEEAAVLAVAAGAADTATAWAPAPVPQVPVVAQGARLAGVAGVAGRVAEMDVAAAFVDEPGDQLRGRRAHCSKGRFQHPARKAAPARVRCGDLIALPRTQ